MVTLTFPSLVYTELVPGQVQHPITDFTKTLVRLHGPWYKQPLIEPTLSWAWEVDGCGIKP